MNHSTQQAMTRTSSYKPYSWPLFALISLCAIASHSGSSMAETVQITDETPSLVVPLGEPSDALADGQEVPSLVVSNDQPNSHSLSGAFLSSYVAHNDGNLVDALRYLKDAYRKDPGNNQIASQILILEITLGHIDNASTLASGLSQAKQRELIVDLLLSIHAAKQGKLAEAHALLKSSTSKSFEQIWSPLLLAWMQEKGSIEKPLKASDLIEDGKTVPTFIHYHLALLNDMHGFNEQAKIQYELAVQNITRAPFRALLAYVNLKAREGKREEIQQLLIELQQGRPGIEELLRQELPYLNNLASDEALPSTPFVQNNQQGVAEVLLTMASMLYALDISQDIPLYLQLAIYLREDFPTAELMLGNYFESLKLWPEANKQYRSIRESSPLYLKAMIRSAFVLEQQGEEEAANNVLTEINNQFPAAIDAWMAAGDLKRRRSDFEGAINRYTQAIDLLDNQFKKQHWAIFFARGASFEQLGKWLEAESDLRQARNLSPKQPEVLNYIGYMWLEQDKKVFEAVELIKKAHALNPNEPHIIDSLGWAFFKTGKLKEAIALLENAAEKIPNDSVVNDHLGDAYWHANRILEARYQWQRAKDFVEDDKHASQLSHKIKNGLSTYSFHTPPIPHTLNTSSGDEETTAAATPNTGVNINAATPKPATQ